MSDESLTIHEEGGALVVESRPIGFNRAIAPPVFLVPIVVFGVFTTCFESACGDLELTVVEGEACSSAAACER